MQERLDNIKCDIIKQNGVYNIYYIDDSEDITQLLFIGYVKKDEPKKLYLSDRYFKLLEEKDREELINIISEELWE